MLEIIGFRNIFFDANDELATTPWHNLLIEKIDIVYFAPQELINHFSVGAHFSEAYLGALIDIAIERHETSDFMADIFLYIIQIRNT